jgi:AraC family transcriptional regulator
MSASNTNYPLKLQPVLRYLETHFKQPLNLKDVAEKAFLSPYHFHRIFKAVTRETLADYLRRLKLEYAAQQLFYNEQSITEIALTLGFSSSQSFAKAFRQYYGLSATDIRNCLTLAQYRALIQNSKIGYLMRNNGNALNEETAYSEPSRKVVKQPGEMIMKTESIKQKHLAYIRVTGPYGEGYQDALEKLYRWANMHSLADGESIMIYHDNPEITPNDKCRTDICISVPQNTCISQGAKVSQGIEFQVLPAGPYAYVRKTITDSHQYAYAWNRLMEQVVESQLPLDDRPCFELYHHFDVETNVADVSFYSAIKLGK